MHTEVAFSIAEQHLQDLEREAEIRNFGKMAELARAKAGQHDNTTHKITHLVQVVLTAIGF